VKVIAFSSRASVLLLPLYSRHPLVSMQNGIAVSVSASPLVPDRHLPASVLPLASLPGAPLPLAYDRVREPLLTWNGVRNKPGP
jgi:hypothetical protein